MSNYDLDTELLAQLPPWYRDILDYQEICRTEKAQFDALAAEINAVSDNFFVQTMGTAAISEWEQIFGIVPDAETEAIVFRCTRLLNRISTRPPFTLAFLRKKLDELIGPDAWTVSVDYPNYTLYIESNAANQQYAVEVAYTVNKIKPAHIVYVNRPYLQSGMLLAETINASNRIFNYRLGAWGLGVSPFASEQEMGVIKMPETPSLQPALLANTAAFVAGDIASARVNASKIITDLTKSVSGDTLTVSYTVNASDASSVTRVELLDSAGTPLTSAAVYIPVTGPTIIKHTIPVKEGVTGNG